MLSFFEAHSVYNLGIQFVRLRRGESGAGNTEAKTKLILRNPSVRQPLVEELFVEASPVPEIRSHH